MLKQLNSMFQPQLHQSLIVTGTTNYDQFVLDPVNRPIKEAKVLALMEEVKEINLLREYPIIVDRNMVVLDGQHRLTVARRLGVPIFYILSENVTTAAIPRAAAHVTQWKMDDYLHHYCALGYPEYLKVKEFRARFSFIGIPRALRLLSIAGKDDERKMFKAGLFTCDSLGFAETVGNYLLDYKQYTPLYKDDKFMAAIANLADNPDYDHARMMRKIDYLSTKLLRCPTTEHYVKMLNDIYNYKTTAGNLRELVMFKTGQDKRRAGRR